MRGIELDDQDVGTLPEAGAPTATTGGTTAGGGGGSGSGDQAPAAQTTQEDESVPMATLATVWHDQCFQIICAPYPSNTVYCGIVLCGHI